MAHRLVLTDQAEADVEAVLKWFSDQRATEAGSRWFTQLMARLDTLEQHPARCAPAPEAEELGQEIRELLLGRRRYKLPAALPDRRKHGADPASLAQYHTGRLVTADRANWQPLPID